MKKGLNLTNYPQLPKLFYSTWGLGFYSEHWLTKLNCWMYGVVKLAEENIDLNTAPSTITAFEKLCASDHMFVYEDPKQQTLARKLFLEQYRAMADKSIFSTREVAATYPIDPFQSIFVYVTLDKPKDSVKFEITKTSGASDAKGNNVILESVCIEQGDLYIYYQYFMLQPGKQYCFDVSNSPCQVSFSTPDFGMPLYIGKQFSVRSKYDQAKVMDKLEKIWGADEKIPLVSASNGKSIPVYTKNELAVLLKGKRVAVYKYNKEFYSLARFQELAPFQIECVFDDTISLKDSSSYTQGETTNIPVINDINAIEEFNYDALILTCALNFETEIQFFKQLVAVAVSRNIPVISLYDDVLNFDIFSKQKIKENNFYIIGLDHPNSIPDGIIAPEASPNNVLAVFGTDSVQGKFTTQLYLREALKQYMRIAHWATEPTGALLGADIGYSRIYRGLTESDRLIFERHTLQELAEKNDLVITGGQNSLIFSPPGKHKESNASTEIFGRFLPRFIVLTVSVDTPIANVKESLNYAEKLAAKHSITSRVVALAMLTGRKVRGSRWTETYFLEVDTEVVIASKQSFHDAFGLPVYVVPDEINEFARELSNIDFLNA